MCPQDMTDARSLLREATAEELLGAAVMLEKCFKSRAVSDVSWAGSSHALAAALCELVAEGRESGAFADALHYRRGEWSDDDESLLRTLAGEP